MDNINLDPQQIQQMILMLQAMLPKTEASPVEQPSQQVVKNKRKKSAPKSKQLDTDKINEPKRINKFDQMMESRMHKEDIAVDKKLSVMPPVPRARPFEFITAVCRVCGKTEKINPVLVTDSLDRYKCNKCSTGAG